MCTVTDFVVQGFGQGDHCCFADNIWAKGWNSCSSSTRGNMNDVALACMRHIACKGFATENNPYQIYVKRLTPMFNGSIGNASRYRDARTLH